MLLAKKLKYTYADYLTWEEGRWEIIEGEVYDMTPAPSPRHQEIVLNLGIVLKKRLKDTSCKTFIAPIDLVLSDTDVVQPDIVVVCDKHQITEKNIMGPPKLVIEVLSFSTAQKDLIIKKRLYEKYKIEEYLIVHPLEMYIEQYCLQENIYGVASIYTPHDILSLCSLEGIEIPLWEIFGIERRDKQKNA